MWQKINQEHTRPIMIIVGFLIAIGAWKTGVIGAVTDLVDDARNAEKNDVDRELITQNYYDAVLDAGGGNFRQRESVPWLFEKIVGDYSPKKPIERLKETEALRFIDGFLDEELVPGAEVIFKGETFKVNSHGQRDDEYEKLKPAGTFRICVAGGSNTMGSGVPNEDAYVNIVEARLNEEMAGSFGYDRYEIINFSVSGYHLLERTYVVKNIIPEWDPDLILVSVTKHDLEASARAKAAKLMEAGQDLELDCIRNVIEAAGVKPSDTLAKMKQRLEPFSLDLVTGAFEEMAGVGEAHGVPVAAMIVRLKVDEVHENLTISERLASEAGLMTMRLIECYEGRTAEEMYLSDIDFHPSLKGHHLIAEEMWERITDHDQITPLLQGDGSADQG